MKNDKLCAWLESESTNEAHGASRQGAARIKILEAALLKIALLPSGRGDEASELALTVLRECK